MNITFLLLTFAIGFLTGLRAFTPLALVCLAAHLNWIPLAGTPLGFLGSVGVLLIVGVMAIGELVNDKRPQTGSRTAPPALVGRIVLGGLCGAAIFLAAHQAWIVGAGAAAVAALIGTFAGFHIRRVIVTGMGVPDIAVALAEDAITIGGAYLVVSHLF